MVLASRFRGSHLRLPLFGLACCEISIGTLKTDRAGHLDWLQGVAQTENPVAESGQLYALAAGPQAWIVMSGRIVQAAAQSKTVPAGQSRDRGAAREKARLPMILQSSPTVLILGWNY